MPDIILTESKLKALLFLLSINGRGDYAEAKKLLAEFNSLPEDQREGLSSLHDMIQDAISGYDYPESV